MPTSRTRIASSFKYSESALKMEKSEAAMDALNPERSIGKAFAPVLRMLFRNARAVQSSESVRTTPMFAVFAFLVGLCILGF